MLTSKMTTMRVALMTIVMLPGLTSPAHAQRTELLTSGMRVRISRDSTHRTTGTIARLSRDSIFLYKGGKDGTPDAIARDGIKLYEVSGGKNRVIGSLKGAGLGIFLGAALGALYGSLQPQPAHVTRSSTAAFCFFGCGTITYSECIRHCDNAGASADAFATAFRMLPVGAVAGAIIGSEKWYAVR